MSVISIHQHIFTILPEKVANFNIWLSIAFGVNCLSYCSIRNFWTQKVRMDSGWRWCLSVIFTKFLTAGFVVSPYCGLLSSKLYLRRRRHCAVWRWILTAGVETPAKITGNFRDADAYPMPMVGKICVRSCNTSHKSQNYGKLATYGTYETG